MTRKIFSICLTFIIVFAFIGCGKVDTPFFDKDVALVKKGTFYFNKSINIGQALDNYKYFNKVKWSSMKTDNGMRIVDVVADFDMEMLKKEMPRIYGVTFLPEGVLLFMKKFNKIKTAQIQIQFIINVDNTFELSWYGYNYKLLDGSVIEDTMSIQFRNGELQHICDNEPFTLWLNSIPDPPRQDTQKSRDAASLAPGAAPVAESPQTLAVTNNSNSASDAVPAAIHTIKNTATPNQEVDNYIMIIKKFIEAEDQRNLSVINKYLSNDMSRYWNIINPTLQEINDRYQYIWGITRYSKNQIISIEKQGESRYILFTRFEYVANNRQKINIKDNRVRFVFDDNMKINEIYGLD